MTSYYGRITKCPQCAGEIATLEVGSCNTFGSTFYVDGYVESGGYDGGHPLLVCPLCKKYIWHDELPRGRILHDFDTSGTPKPGGMQIAEGVHGRDHIDALRQAPWKTDAQEQALRIRARWSFHHTNGELASLPEARAAETRQLLTKEDTTDLSPEQEENLQKLLALLDLAIPEERLMRADVLRELGAFDDCLATLKHKFRAGYDSTVRTIASLAKARRRHVAIIEIGA